jgi:hypothetical protein
MNRGATGKRFIRKTATDHMVPFSQLFQRGRV